METQAAHVPTEVDHSCGLGLIDGKPQLAQARRTRRAGNARAFSACSKAFGGGWAEQPHSKHSGEAAAARGGRQGAENAGVTAARQRGPDSIGRGQRGKGPALRRRRRRPGPADGARRVRLNSRRRPIKSTVSASRRSGRIGVGGYPPLDPQQSPRHRETSWASGPLAVGIKARHGRGAAELLSLHYTGRTILPRTLSRRRSVRPSSESAYEPMPGPPRAGRAPSPRRRSAAPSALATPPPAMEVAGPLDAGCSWTAVSPRRRLTWRRRHLLLDQHEVAAAAGCRALYPAART